MAEKKDSILIASPLISCNHVCAALKEKGLPYDSVWLQIGHIINHIDKITCLNDEQKQKVRQAFDDYLVRLRKKDKAEVDRLGREFLAEIDRMKNAEMARSLKIEQDFNAELINAISKNLHQLYSIIGRNDACGMIDSLKADTLNSIRSAKNRGDILKIVEAGFNDVNSRVKTAQEKMELSMESLLVLESNAIIDKLTGIFNRRFFDQELPKVVQTFLDKEGKVPFSLLLIDIDKFKEVNDTYGHQIGDKVLKEVGRVILSNLRKIDFPCRYGGDEILILLPQASGLEARRLSERLSKELSELRIPVPFSKTKELRVTMSIGVSTFPQDGSTMDGLLEKADDALYWVKSHGRGAIALYSDVAEEKKKALEAGGKTDVAAK